MPVKNKAGNGTLYKEYSISAVPQTVFADASGKEIDRIVGYLSPAQFLQKMQSILTGYVS